MTRLFPRSSSRSVLRGALFIVVVAISGCTVKVGGAPPTNYDYSEYETYGTTHGESPAYDTASRAPVAQTK